MSTRPDLLTPQQAVATKRQRAAAVQGQPADGSGPDSTAGRGTERQPWTACSLLPLSLRQPAGGCGGLHGRPRQQSGSGLPQSKASLLTGRVLTPRQAVATERQRAAAVQGQPAGGCGGLHGRPWQQSGSGLPQSKASPGGRTRFIPPCASRRSPTRRHSRSSGPGCPGK